MQDRIIAEARPPSSYPRRYPFSLARTMCLHETRRLGFRQQAIQRTETVLGTSDFAQVCSVGCPKDWNPKAHRVAHVAPLCRVPDYAELDLCHHGASQTNQQERHFVIRQYSA